MRLSEAEKIFRERILYLESRDRPRGIYVYEVHSAFFCGGGGWYLYTYLRGKVHISSDSHRCIRAKMYISHCFRIRLLTLSTTFVLTWCEA